MTYKEKLWVGLGALFISNASVILTLFMSGYFDSSQEVDTPSKEKLEAQMAYEAEIANKYKFKPVTNSDTESHLNDVKTLSEAIYICADKVESSVSSPKSYSFDYKASYYAEEEGTYKIFIDLETPSTANLDRKVSEVTCEVSASTRAISNYMVMDKLVTDK